MNLSSPPLGPVENVDDMIGLLKEHIAARQRAARTWVIGWNQDDSLLAEGRHPTRSDLDKASIRRPVYLLHVSGHLATVNSTALALAGYMPGLPIRQAR